MLYCRYNILPSAMRTAIYIGTGLSLLTLTAFSFTPIGANVASVIGAGDQLGNACLEAINIDSAGAVPRDASEILKTDLNDDGTDDRVITLTNPESCGTNGCIHEMCLTRGSSVERIQFGYAANTLTVLSTKTNGMYDLNLDNRITLNWDGERYALSE